MALIGDFVSGQNNVSYTRMRQLLEDTSLQEGVFGAGDFKVTQATGSNMQASVAVGSAWVAVDTGTRNGFAHVVSDAVATITLGGSNATNPRIDQIILRYNDAAVPTGAGNLPTIEPLAGTATAGATLANRTNAATLPADAIRLADILVPAASSAVTDANIRDRRPWARGAYNRSIRTGGNISTTQVTQAEIDGGMRFRLECSGVPIRVRLTGTLSNSATGNQMWLYPFVDGAMLPTTERHERSIHSPGANYNIDINSVWDLTTVAAGSHLFNAGWATAAGTATMLANTTAPLVLTVEEIVGQNANNGTS